MSTAEDNLERGMTCGYNREVNSLSGNAACGQPCCCHPGQASGQVAVSSQLMGVVSSRASADTLARYV